MQRYLGQRKEVKIYISNDDTYEGEPLFEVLLKLVKDEGLSGATVTKAVAGIGAHSQIHTFSAWVLKQKVPLIVSIIDTEEKIRGFLQKASAMIEEGLVTLHDVEVVLYHHPKFKEA